MGLKVFPFGLRCYLHSLAPKDHALQKDKTNHSLVQTMQSDQTIKKVPNNHCSSEVSSAHNPRPNLTIPSTNSSSPPQTEEPRNRNRTRIWTQPVCGSQSQIKTIIAGMGVDGAQLLASLEDLDLAHDEVWVVGLRHHAGAITDVEPPAASLVRYGVEIRVFL